MNMQKTQRGMSFFGLIALVAVGSFVFMMGVRLIPLYMDDLKVKNALDTLQNVEIKTREALVKQFMRQLEVNDVRSIQKEELKLEPQGGGFSISLDYEIRVPVLYNIDAVVKFSHQREIN